jgi:hypothetical protein
VVGAVDIETSPRTKALGDKNPVPAEDKKRDL